ncbi:MAG: hypothetical protein WD512_20445 [Candidatus Paceibacterota bacterium]
MNHKQLKSISDIKKLAESICVRTPVDIDIVAMIIKLVEEIELAEEIEKMDRDQ